jgi:hypothetical protein
MFSDKFSLRAKLLKLSFIMKIVLIIFLVISLTYSFEWKRLEKKEISPLSLKLKSSVINVNDEELTWQFLENLGKKDTSLFYEMIRTQISRKKYFYEKINSEKLSPRVKNSKTNKSKVSGFFKF